ncbi:MAG: hypothetical protein RLZ83_2131 [Pseudomonadota bacterium]|jgi:hypothetical protein
MASGERIAALRALVKVPDDYATWRRMAGLYWLMRVPFAHGVRQWQAGTRAAFDQPLSRLSLAGEPVHYEPPRAPAVPPAGDLATLLKRASSASALGIPDPQGADREALFSAFHPVWYRAVQVDVQVGGRAKALDQSDGTTVSFAGLEPGSVQQVPRDHALHYLQHQCYQLGLRGQQHVQRQHQLANRQVRDDVIDQVRRRLGHSACAA